MQAIENASTHAPGASAYKNEEIIRFRAADWLRRWAANGNSVELMPDGGLWVLYGRGRAWRRRDALELELRAQGAVSALKALLSRAGMSRIGAMA